MRNLTLNEMQMVGGGDVVSDYTSVAFETVKIAVGAVGGYKGYQAILDLAAVATPKALANVNVSFTDLIVGVPAAFLIGLGFYVGANYITHALLNK